MTRYNTFFSDFSNTEIRNSEFHLDYSQGLCMLVNSIQKKSAGAVLTLMNEMLILFEFCLLNVT